MQIRERKIKDQANQIKDKQFHKTHYGPEETFEVSQMLQSNLNESKAKINEALQKQIRYKNERKEKMNA